LVFLNEFTPSETILSASISKPESVSSNIDNFGFKESKCYGCGRCLNSCPLNLISEYEYNLS